MVCDLPRFFWLTLVSWSPLCPYCWDLVGRSICCVCVPSCMGIIPGEGNEGEAPGDSSLGYNGP